MKRVIIFELELLIKEKYIHKIYYFESYEEACAAADDLYRKNKTCDCQIEICRIEKTREVMPWPNH